MKKTISTIIAVVVIALSFALTAHADTGPKPSVVIDFNDLNGKTYYVTLLSEAKSRGPYSALTDRGDKHANYQTNDSDYNAFRKFVEYKDADGYYFIQYFQDCSQTQQFQWTYYPPEIFKILIYFPDTDTFIASKSYSCYAFDSYFTVYIADLNLSPEAQNAGEIVVQKSYDYTKEIISLIIRIIITLAIEIALALAFGFREKKLIRFIIVVNFITQISLNLALNLINYYSGALAFYIFYILLEIGVFIIEASIYTVYMKKISKKEIPSWKPFVYALVANLASFAIGVILAGYFIWLF